MPGFVAGGIGQGLWGQPQVFLAYTWTINNLFGDSQDAVITAQSITLPSFTVGKLGTVGTSLVYKYAKTIDFEDVRVTFYDTSNLVEILMNWRQSIWQAGTGIASANDYKRTSLISTFLPDGSATNSWQLVNSWPSAIRYGDLTYTSSDAKVCTVDITYDWMLENPSGVATGAEAGVPYPPMDTPSNLNTGNIA